MLSKETDSGKGKGSYAAAPIASVRRGLKVTFEVGNPCPLCGIRSLLPLLGENLLGLIRGYMEFSRIV